MSWYEVELRFPGGQAGIVGWPGPFGGGGGSLGRLDGRSDS